MFFWCLIPIFYLYDHSELLYSPFLPVEVSSNISAFSNKGGSDNVHTKLRVH